MLLVVDVGNTHTVAGIYDEDSAPAVDPSARWRWQTHRSATADELAVTIAGMLELDGHALADITRVAVSSVVPQLTATWRSVAERHLQDRRLLVVGPGLRTGFRLAVDEPHEVGADRIVNAVAAWERYAGPCIVVDLGTATTFDVIADGPTYVGGAIAPGIGVSVRALVDRAARLSSVDLHVPLSPIGRDTADSVRSGTMLGAVAMLDGMLARLRDALVAEHGCGTDVHVPAIATGGFATTLHDHVVGLDAADPDLTLRGLQLLALHR
ncbi:MAG: type III pantothenate kinase [Thermoleophilia bacterium]|nr:type III pantothenate kinase [Thermoleophilia bacterium]